MPRITELMSIAPDRIRRLPRDARGYPIPKFVKWLADAETGQLRPEFRIIDNEHMRRCTEHNLCWVCGGHMGVHKTFVIGVLSSVSGASGEPPSHRDCAEFAVQACPYLANPTAQRTLDDSKHGTVPLPGSVDYKGSVNLTWTTQRYAVHQYGGGIIFLIGQPESVTWWREGRHATRQECVDALWAALPTLLEHQRRQGLPDFQMLRSVQRTEALLPPEETPA